jgi:hypothetical protein
MCSAGEANALGVMAMMIYANDLTMASPWDMAIVITVRLVPGAADF